MHALIRELIELCTGLLQRQGHVLPATRARTRDDHAPRGTRSRTA
ncbi:hypothetical protein [Dokdonella sp.]